jgi:hypothetical protein
VLPNKYGPEALQIATTVKWQERYGSSCFDYGYGFKNNLVKLKSPIL